jgi:UDP-glucuronate decarboxylase
MRRHSRKRVLVTGGAGFLGSHLCERLLKQGDEVVCVDNFFTGAKDNVHRLMDNPHFEVIRHDVNFPLYLEVDEIYNLACPASPIHYQYDPIQTTKTSVLGAINMLGLAKRTKAKIFHASTSEVYGDPEVHPQPENYWGHVNPKGRRACYDEGKRCAESLFFDYARQHDLRIKVARIFNTYGPRMHPEDGRVVSNFVIQALRNDPITIYGDGSQTRSFCYVDDLIEGFVRLMHSRDDLQGPVNLGNPAEFTILELAEKVIDLTGSRSRLEFRPLPSDDPRQRQPDITLARSELGWQPKVSLNEGLKKTIDHFERLLASSAQVGKVDFVRFDRRQLSGERRQAEQQNYRLIGEGKDRRRAARDRRRSAVVDCTPLTARAAAE